MFKTVSHRRNDDKDWEVKQHNNTLNNSSEATQILLTTIEGPAEFTEECRQAEKMRPIA